jgi:hypothetical protein
LQAKTESGDSVCAGVSGLFASEPLSARDGMRCALVLLDYPAGKVFEGISDLGKLPNPELRSVALHSWPREEVVNEKSQARRHSFSDIPGIEGLEGRSQDQERYRRRDALKTLDAGFASGRSVATLRR